LANVQKIGGYVKHRRNWVEGKGENHANAEWRKYGGQMRYCETPGGQTTKKQCYGGIGKTEMSERLQQQKVPVGIERIKNLPQRGSKGVVPWGKDSV